MHIRYAKLVCDKCGKEVEVDPSIEHPFLLPAHAGMILYATVDRKTGQLHSLSYIGSDGKRYKQVDVEDHKGMGPHAHDGYDHGGDARKLSPKERRTLATVRGYIRLRGGIG